MTQAQNLADLSQLFTKWPLPFRNKLINGKFPIWQRGGGPFNVLTGTVTYTVDRWYTWTNGATITVDLNPPSPHPGFAQSYHAKGAAGTTRINVGQRIESANAYDLAGPDGQGQLCTASGWIWSSQAITPQFLIYIPGASDNFATTTVVTNVVLPPLVANTWTYFSTTFMSSSQYHLGCQYEIDFPVTGAGDIAVTGCQLESGSVATQFEHRPWNLEMYMCQRYYQQVNSGNPRCWGGITGANTADFIHYPPVGFHHAPTVGLYQSGAGTLMESMPFVQAITATFTLSSVHVPAVGPLDFQLQVASPSPAITLAWPATWLGGLTLNAEL